MKHRVQIKDVARAVGVSPATISRSFNNPELVNALTLQRIKEAIRALGYLPDGTGRALSSRRNNTVGLIVPTLDHAIFSRFTQAMQTSLAEAGYQLLIASHEYNPVLELNSTRTLIERGVEAIVFVGVERSAALKKLLTQSNIPVLSTWNLDPAPGSTSVGFDNKAASAMATQHLLDLGHRQFGVISGFQRYNDRARARVEGVRETLERAGIKLTSANIIEQLFSYASGRNGLDTLMKLRTPPTAIICGNDLLAIGALIECEARGIAVPTDLSIVGFDNHELASHVFSGLTTVDVPTALLGQRSAEVVVGMLNKTGTTGSVELPVELIVRGSTGLVRQPV